MAGSVLVLEYYLLRSPEKLVNHQTCETMWKEENNKLKNSFKFKDFKQAFAFMQKVAATVDEMDHHPWWSNMYNQVDFELNTHDAGDVVTDKDRKLANAIDRIYEEL